ncbi:S-layer homology domain-containing protein [Paenibacillus aestuarii]|uniref:S-layer homology domain-containing protein n=1 Tax=Paenibacillus aestuarii TaxID=516965 RepID=A0ABW0K791_9BACL
MKKKEWIIMVWKKTWILGAILSTVAASGCQAVGGQSVSAEAAPIKTAPAKVALTDIDSHWAKDAILNGIKHGYVDGYEDSTFRPENNVSRAEFIKLLVTATGMTVDKNNGTNWYDSYVKTVDDLGVYHQDDFPLDQLNSPLTRVEMAKLAVRTVEKESRPKTANYYDTAVMSKATELGIIQGLAGGELGPDRTTTRAQAITIIERVLKAQKGEKLPADKAAVSMAEIALKGTNVENMWNMKIKDLPISLANGQGVDYKLTQVIVVDMGDPNSAYYSEFKDWTLKESRLITNTDISNYYVVAYHLVAKSDGKGTHDYFNAPVYVKGADGPANSPYGAFNSNNKYQPISGLLLDESKTVDDWRIYVYSKSKVSSNLTKYGFVNLVLGNTYDNNDNLLTIQQK